MASVDRAVVRRVLNQLAFEAHRDQPGLLGTADVAEPKLLQALMSIGQDPDKRPGRLLEYLRDRAGLLEPRGLAVYAFPHRTFQEYLAACHLTDDGFPDKLAELVLQEPNRWREVTLLAAGKAGRGTAAAIWTLAETLCDRPAPASKEGEEQGYWGALLAAQALLENHCLERRAPRNREKLERVRQWLVGTLDHEALLPVDRAQAGDALAQLGDPRFRADAWYLPDEPFFGFVKIEAGEFCMGSDARKDTLARDEEFPQHRLHLPGYYIARYPVTVAQFQAFVSDSDYGPVDADCLEGLPNHPVVNITWYEALKYCQWLTERLKGWKGTAQPLVGLMREQGWQVTLPSEAEWEKAARGGDGRLYPWGDEFENDRCNSGETGVGRTTAVGCFPSGACPCGCLDMAGNVWEWTRSLWGKDPEERFRYPYKRDKREELRAPDCDPRGLRGGSFLGDRLYVRCAFRLWYSPDFRYRNLGFRVVVLPSPNSEL
jgi:formylglycine-generating enzyme required for sulfatase activity